MRNSKLFLITLLSLPLFSESYYTADKVIIKKSTHMLYLSSGGEIFKKFHISLGQVPVGAKEFEGDMKTPEGRYRLDWRKISSKYNKSIHISYPNQEEKKSAKAMGLNAGGMIMIHGTPLNWGLLPVGNWIPKLLDWTEGCIAMSNDDMEEVWNSTQNGTEIVILP